MSQPTGTTGTSYKKKLIEVALPLEAINRESAREKSIRHGHPATLHLWWARRPLAACRAVLFASLVDDPSAHPDRFPTEEAQQAERERLFRIIEQLVLWENSNSDVVLDAARREILASTDGNPPPVLDPFCGGGSIPLEAQRLGLEAHASDLNPVAVLITKALIEIPPTFANRPPVNPEDRRRSIGAGWRGAAGLAADVRYHGRWMRDEAERRIGHLYPKVRLPAERGGGEATVIAWLWARTVTCPNPACGARMPLVRSFALSTKKGKEAWVEPVVERGGERPEIRFRIHSGTPDAARKSWIGAGTGLVNERGKKTQATFVCPACKAGIAKGEYIDREANEGRMGAMPLAVVAEARRGRIYLPFDTEQVEAAHQAADVAATEEVQAKVPREPARGTFASNAQGRIYGFKTFADYFTPRQLVALTTFSDLVGEARERVRADALAAGLPDDGVPLAEGGRGAQAYADAVATYLAFALDKAADRNSSLCTWENGMDRMRNTFGRQALPMVWDYAETNPFAGAGGDIAGTVGSLCEALDVLPSGTPGQARQLDAAVSVNGVASPMVSTDPPYYDNVGYADLSDFFYVWLRRSLGTVYPTLFSTLLTPKTPELIASPYRFGGDREKAEHFFEEGLGRAFQQMHDVQHPGYPLTVYYAFKQAESDGADDDGLAGTASTGWETMLEGLIRAGFAVNGTWPMRTELATRSIGRGTNALASSIVLACRPRPEDAPLATRAEFHRALRRELPEALRHLQQGAIAPVDLAQAAIGPGMAVYSRYSRVLEPSGQPLRVRAALQLINQVLDEVLTEQEGEFDADTRWAVAWFEQHGAGEGPYGDAETLSKAKDCSVGGLVEAGIVRAGQGKVRLLRRDELDPDWNPLADRHLTVWEVTQHLMRALTDGGEDAAAQILGQVGGLGDAARDLAYRLYTTCERRGWASEALDYNALVVAWTDVQKQLRPAGGAARQRTLM